MSIKEKAQKLKKEVPAVFIALKKKDTPVLAKIFAGLTVGYALSPVDLIPDFVPVLGYLDDLIILPLLVALTVKLIPKEIWEQSKIEAEGLWENGKPKRWYYSIPIILLWLLIIWLIVKAIWL
ncbi:MAG: DUF1232 domain-containing protein [Eubacteriales bacterium]|nr:DUF1232 domain-containing protein [Eubacteriales bacterium]